jgi:pSer/pThr/pTyr-binding forkhead associated (FHA) protein
MSKIYLIDAETHKPFLVEGSAMIGRDESCELSWASSSLSPKHLCVSHKNDNFFVECLDNKNPVSLNGIKILSGQKYLVKKGDSLEFARRKFIFSATNELPEETISQIRDDIFGLGADFNVSLSDLKLDKDYGSESADKHPKDEMKKSRRVIVEIQRTKKQLMSKIAEQKKLLDEKEFIEKEVNKIQKQIEQTHKIEHGKFLRERETELSELRSLEKKIDELKKLLSTLVSQRDEKKARLDSDSPIVDILNEEEKFLEKQKDLENELSVLTSLSLEEKLEKLEQCLKDEQENYQRLHDFKALNSSQKKRTG